MAGAFFLERQYGTSARKPIDFDVDASIVQGDEGNMAPAVQIIRR
jgi:hypothetical protein